MGIAAAEVERARQQRLTAGGALDVRLIDIQAERAKRSLHYFLTRFAWPALEPATPFGDNWHIGVMCEHLEAVARGDIQRLIINLPFRHLKSTLVSQAFPAWVWTWAPSRRFLTASYASDLAVRDAVNSRRIIESPRYQQAWGAIFRLTGDQNVKSRYENDQRGARTTTATGAAGTGHGGDIRIIDDPVSALMADSDAAIKASTEWWRGTMSTRANDPRNSPAIVVHQRLNDRDLTGYLLSEERGWEHLVLPMRYDPALRKTTSLGYQDPRTEPGQLLHPERVPEETAKGMEATLGAYHTNAQLQQNPSPRGGIIFARSAWGQWTELPEVEEVVLSLDCTFKATDSSDYVALQAWGRIGARHYLLRRLRERLTFTKTVEAARSFSALYPDAVAFLIEDKANGSAVIDTISDAVRGVIPINPEGGKVARAYAMQPAQEAGQIFLPAPSVDPGIEEFITEASGFPGLPHDDEVDAMTQYMNWSRARYATSGLMEFMRQQAAERRAAAEQQHKSAAGLLGMMRGG